MKKTIIALLIVIVVIVGVILYLVLPDKGGNFGSVTTGQAYNATSTADFAGVVVSKPIRQGWGSLGSVIITKVGDAEFALYDATTTPNSIDDFATSTKLLAQFGASMAAGTYQFDVQYIDGLALHVVAGNNGSSTITFR